MSLLRRPDEADRAEGLRKNKFIHRCDGNALMVMHEVILVLQADRSYDEVTVSCHEGPSSSINVTTDSSEIPEGQDNIAWKAAKLMREIFPDKTSGDISICIKKRIPAAAGLGGGSADAAAVLLALNSLCECDLSVAELMKIGVKLGADVPFCIMGQAAKIKAMSFVGEAISTCALAEGIGERLTPLTPLKAYAVLLKPDTAVSTAEVYKNLDIGAIERRPDTASLLEGLKNMDFPMVESAMYNVLEDVSTKKHPVIQEGRRWLQGGASHAKVMMSGSGPTVFALTPDKGSAEAIYNRIKGKDYRVFLVRTSF